MKSTIQVKSFTFTLAQKTERELSPIKVRDGIAIAGCSLNGAAMFGMAFARMSDGGEPC